MIMLTIAKVIAMLAASCNWCAAGCTGVMPLLMMLMPMLGGICGGILPGIGGLLGG